jgi:aryl-alcohol dehydrogenase-like predicted oxidoreductase
LPTLAGQPGIGPGLPVPGTGSPGHAEANVAAAAIERSPDEVAAITRGG